MSLLLGGVGRGMFKLYPVQLAPVMPSVVAGISDGLDGFIDELVERGQFESRSKAAAHLLEYAAVNKYDADV